MQDFRKLRVWQAARALTTAVYRATASFPPSERFGLAMQLRTAASSVSANIAEAAGRGSPKDSKRCLQIAYGSDVELLNHLIIANDLELLSAPESDALSAQAESIRRMLAGLMARLKQPTGPKARAHRAAGPPA